MESCSWLAATWCSRVAAATTWMPPTMKCSNSRRPGDGPTRAQVGSWWLAVGRYSKRARAFFAQRPPTDYQLLTVLIGALSLTSAPAYAQYEAPPFDSIHLAVPEISSARDWYLAHMGGNVGETADRVAFGNWTGDHPIPLQLIFEVSAAARPSAGSVLD